MSHRSRDKKDSQHKCGARAGFYCRRFTANDTRNERKDAQSHPACSEVSICGEGGFF